MPTARPSALLFDWDNTLVDGWAGITAALNAAFTAFGHPTWTVQDTRNRVRVSLRESFPVMFGDQWEQARDIFYSTLSNEHLSHITPMPGVPGVLETGAAWPQGVVSNKAGRFLRREVDHLGWGRFFGPVIGAGDATADKPAPAPRPGGGSGACWARRDFYGPRRSADGTDAPVWTAPRRAIRTPCMVRYRTLQAILLLAGPRDRCR